MARPIGLGMAVAIVGAALVACDEPVVTNPSPLTPLAPPPGYEAVRKEPPGPPARQVRPEPAPEPVVEPAGPDAGQPPDAGRRLHPDPPLGGQVRDPKAKATAKKQPVKAVAKPKKPSLKKK